MNSAQQRFSMTCVFAFASLLCLPVAWGAEPSKASEVAASKRFAFHSHFWINLHHFLYQEAEAKTKGRPAAAGSDALVEAEQKAWQEVLTFYQQEVISKDLTFSREMNELKGRLITLETLDPAPFEDLEPAMYAPLEKAAPIYRKYWWPTHDQANRRWIEVLQPRLRTLEDTFATRLEKAYGGVWPEETVRVDVSCYGGWAGAYTSSYPITHAVISSLDSGYQGDSGFEMLFHETSHAGSLIRPLQNALKAAFGKHGERAPRGLWHVLLFWTSGEIARQLLLAQGVEEYVPYAMQKNLYQGAWGTHREALEGTWTAYLAGEVERGAAYEQIAAKWLKLQGSIASKAGKKER